MTESNPRFKVRDIHIIRRAALWLAFENCPLCGERNSDTPFVKMTDSGLAIEFDEMDAKVDMCHLDSRAKGGVNSDTNLFVGHHRCNVKMGRDSIDIHCEEYRTVLSANEIRERVREANAKADAMLSGSVFFPAIAKKALDLINTGKPHRTGTDWMKKIQAA
jgi:hypothetical protein